LLFFAQFAEGICGTSRSCFASCENSTYLPVTFL